MHEYLMLDDILLLDSTQDFHLNKKKIALDGIKLLTNRFIYLFWSK